MNWHSGYDRIPQDRYETDEWVSEIILPYIEHLSRLWEPACASGKMVRVLARGGRFVVSSDINGGIDFLKQPAFPFAIGAQGIVTNPPFSLAQEFVEHALTLMRPARGLVAMLLPVMWDCAQERDHLFKPHPAWRQKIVIRRRIRWIPGTKGNPRLYHAWYIWDWRPGKAKPAAYWNPPEEPRRRKLKLVAA